MIVISIGADPKLFEEGSRVWARQKEYGKLLRELHIISYTNANPVHNETKISRNVFIYPTNNKRKIFFFWTTYKIVARIMKRLRKRGDRIVITSQDGMTDFISVILSLRFSLPLQVQVHTDILSPYFKRESFKNKIALLGYWLGVKRARSVRVVSSRIKNSLISRWHINSKKIKVEPIKVNLPKREIERDGENFKYDLHKMFPQFAKIVVMASRLEKEKNIPMALEAFSKVANKMKDVGLVIFGDGSMRGQLEKQVEQLGIEKKVEFLGWKEFVSKYFASSDIFLLTSNYEGYGLVLVEALLARVPIITTDVGLVGDIINEHNSLIVPVGESNKLAAALIFLLQNDSARLLMKERLDAVALDFIRDQKSRNELKRSWML